MKANMRNFAAGMALATFASTGIILGMANAHPQRLPPPPGAPTKCAGSDASAEHSNVLSCPLQPGAVDILCSGPGSDLQGGTCNPKGMDERPPSTLCYCTNGNFCCNLSGGMEVPGGENPVDYYNDVAWNCNG
ncbi:uncharacterized protein LTR77_003890 [Saxophila tyrrhenica]|uniref:Secreted protein n=1 Tax=Saxophila tyrrhenica TaxID=1690608 RepID=A0AAV9PGH0_9PEZI|nr:hypothetical protein LTR77_003890 [Saxophila tyrrhenica]